MENWNPVLSGTTGLLGCWKDPGKTQRKSSQAGLHSTHLDRSKGRENSCPHGKFLRANDVVEARPNCGSVLPLDHINASVNLLELEETCTENKAKQDVRVETPSPEPPVWKRGIRADFSGLSEGERQSFNGLLEE